jgi:tetratricopeptide (TPR) repeat protein
LLDDQGRSEAAIECLRKALLVAPTYLDAMFNLALLLQRKSAYAEAAEYWRRYLATDHASEWAARATLAEVLRNFASSRCPASNG